MLEIDHVIITVRDLDEAAGRLRRDHGLASAPGGRHPGHGTGNRIVPLGEAYIELMAVVDEVEAQTSPLGRWVVERTTKGDHPAALCLRTDGIDTIAGQLGLETLTMSRHRPDGTELGWVLAGMDRMIEDGSPFFIEWRIDPQDHPGRMPVEHDIEVTGVAWVEIGGGGIDFREVTGGSGLDVRVVDGSPPGVRRVAIASSRGDIVL